MQSADQRTTAMRARWTPTRRGGLFLAGGGVLLAFLLAAMLSPAVGPDAQWLGMEVEPMTPSLAAGLGLPPDQTGVYVSDVVGAALQSGVREGDVIVAVDGRPVKDLASLGEARRGSPAAALLTVKRQGQTVSLSLSAAAMPVLPPSLAAAALSGPPPPAGLPYQGQGTATWGPGSRTSFGAEVTNLTPEAALRIGLAPPYRGALVTGLAAAGMAGQAGLQRGDLILHVNGYDVVDAAQLWPLLAGQPLGAPINLDVYRAGRLLQLAAPAPDAALLPAAWAAPCPLR